MTTFVTVEGGTPETTSLTKSWAIGVTGESMKGIFDFKNRGLELVAIDGKGGLVGFRTAEDMIDAMVALGGRPHVFFRPSGGEMRLSTVAEFEAAPKGSDDFRRKTKTGVYELGWLEER